MYMDNHFIKNIKIKSVRHHMNKEIVISNTEKKHLIITGRNGSGKTSLLESIMKFLKVFEKDFSLEELYKWNGHIENYNKTLSMLLESIKSNNNNSHEIKEKIREMKNNIQIYTKLLNKFADHLMIDFYEGEEIQQLYNEGQFIIAYYKASRVANMGTPQGVEKIELSEKPFLIDDNVGHIFIKYLVDLKTKQMFASNEGDYDFANKVSEWFVSLEKNLKMIFENDSLELFFDYKDYNFLLREPGKEPYSLNALSSGFSSIINIVTDLIMRIEGKRQKANEVEGIVLIDEVEAHLHVSLQKKILKFLTEFFPNIQFIVTTHSPFVISSIENATIYDLEKSILLEDLSNYSYRAIVEEFLGVDQYSYIVKEKIQEYEQLINRLDNLTPHEKQRLEELNKDLSNVPNLSKELELQKAFFDLNIVLRGDLS